MKTNKKQLGKIAVTIVILYLSALITTMLIDNQRIINNQEKIVEQMFN